MTFLLDTNTVIYLINDRLAMALSAGRYGVSVITEIELLSFPDLQVDEEQRIRAFLGIADRNGHQRADSRPGDRVAPPA